MYSKGMFGVLLHWILTNQEKQVDWNLDISKYNDTTKLEVGTGYGLEVPVFTDSYRLKEQCCG